MHFMSVCKDQISQWMRLPPFHKQQFRQQYNNSIISRHKKDNSMSSPTTSGILHHLNFGICIKKNQLFSKHTD